MRLEHRLPLCLRLRWILIERDPAGLLDHAQIRVKRQLTHGEWLIGGRLTLHPHGLQQLLLRQRCVAVFGIGVAGRHHEDRVLLVHQLRRLHCHPFLFSRLLPVFSGCIIFRSTLVRFDRII